MSSVPFAQLQAFLAVARTCSFIGAARELGISRSAVSQSVRQLETDLDVVLVARTQRPEDLLQHECLTFRSETNGSLYARELERGRKTWRIPRKGGLVANDGLILTDWAEQGLGLGYVFEPLVAEQLRNGTCSSRTRQTCPASISSIRAARSVRRRCRSSSRR